MPILQREGRFKFDLTAGDFRSGNSQQSSPFFFSGHGTRRFTTGIYCLRRDAIICQLHRLLLGLGRNLGNWGAVSLDVTHARSQLADDSRHGDSIRFLYAKSMNTFGTNFQLMGYRYSTQGFIPLMMLRIVEWRVRI